MTESNNKTLMAVVVLLLLVIVINPIKLSAQYLSPAKGQTNFVLTIQDDLLSLKATDALLVEVLQEIGKRMKIELVASLRDQAKVNTQFEKLSLEEAIKKLTANYSYAMLSEESGKKISKIVILQNDTARSNPVIKEPETKKQDSVPRSEPSVKREIVRENRPIAQQPFKFEFDPSQFEKRR